MIAVTSFSRTGYETYGHRMIESCLRHWPGKLIVYSEVPLEWNHEKLEIRDFFSIPNVMTFLQYIQNVPIAHGKINGIYNYNYDLWKYCRKVFAQYDVLRENPGKVFWLDADTYLRKPISESFLEGVFQDKPLAYLGREGLYTETGVIGFDTRGEKFDEFLAHYIGCLRAGTVFTLPRWHDCQIFDWAREVSGIEGTNLSPFFIMPDARKLALDDLDVIERSVLGEYILHLKGNRKDLDTRKSHYRELPPEDQRIH